MHDRQSQKQFYNDHTLSEKINFSKCMIGDHKNSLGKPIQGCTKYHME